MAMREIVVKGVRWVGEVTITDSGAVMWAECDQWRVDGEGSANPNDVLDLEEKAWRHLRGWVYLAQLGRGYLGGRAKWRPVASVGANGNT